MRTGYGDRLWMIGGVIVAVALLVVGWFTLISPQNAERA